MSSTYVDVAGACECKPALEAQRAPTPGTHRASLILSSVEDSCRLVQYTYTL